MAIVYREVKGSPLTWPELDANFADLAARTALSWSQIGVGTDFFYQTNKFGTATKIPPFV